MADNIAEIRKLFDEKGVPLGRDDVWSVQGVAVVKHKALERLAAKSAIQWREPKVLRFEADEAVILVTGAIGDHAEWSIGEARVVPMADTGRKNQWNKPIYEATPGATGNYQITPKQSAYPYAMAEKRGKDRVIIKLAGIDAYSEEESDDFSARHGSRDDPPAPEMDTLLSAEKSLEAAAMLGMDSLKRSWASLSQATRDAMGGKAPDRLKQIASEHDKRAA